MDPSVLNSIKKGGPASANTDKVNRRGSLSHAAAMTQVAINNLGGPVYASMTDNKIKDASLAQAKTLVAIASSEGKSVASAPADRAIAESRTLAAIASGKASEKLNKVETAASGAGLTVEQLQKLQQAAEEEKKRMADAKKFGGGDAKQGMTNILGEISSQGVIAVPAEKAAAKTSNVFLNQTKTLMEINALGKQGKQPVSQTDHKIVDASLVQAQTLIAIQKKGEATPGQGPKDRAINEALTLKAIQSSAPRSRMKKTEAPDTSLDQAKLAELQKLAIEEKAEMGKRGSTK